MASKVVPGNCSSDDFWDYVFSDKWDDYSSLRVEEGQLLDKLLNNLFILEEKENLKGYKLSQFDVIKTNRKGCLINNDAVDKGQVYVSDQWRHKDNIFKSNKGKDYHEQMFVQSYFVMYLS